MASEADSRSGSGMDDQAKRRRWRQLQAQSNAAVDELGLGPGALPDGDERD